MKDTNEEKRAAVARRRQHALNNLAASRRTLEATGQATHGPTYCTACGGDGYLSEPHRNSRPGTSECPYCKGTGKQLGADRIIDNFEEATDAEKK